MIHWQLTRVQSIIRYPINTSAVKCRIHWHTGYSAIIRYTSMIEQFITWYTGNKSTVSYMILPIGVQFITKYTGNWWCTVHYMMHSKQEYSPLQDTQSTCYQFTINYMMHKAVGCSPCYSSFISVLSTPSGHLTLFQRCNLVATLFQRWNNVTFLQHNLTLFQRWNNVRIVTLQIWRCFSVETTSVFKQNGRLVECWEFKKKNCQFYCFS